MPLSVTRAASLNGSRVRAAATRLMTRDSSGALSRFHELADRSAFSSNVSADKIEVFDVHGAILDARAIEQYNASGDRTAGLRAFRLRQRDWLVRRIRFEALWRHGRRFIYGALNAGGIGTEGRYGPFCLVIADPGSCAPSALAVFPADSAERYCSAAGAVDRDRARAEAVAWSDRAALTTIERASEALATPPGAWPQVICAPGRYLEAVIAPGPSLDSVSAVRVRQAYRDRLDDLRVQALDDDLQPGTALRELAAYEALRRWRVAHGIAIEGVG